MSLRRLEFTNNPNDVLLGNGTWGSASGYALCTDLTGSSNLAGNSKTILNNFNLYFEDGTNPAAPGVNQVAVGYQCSQPLPAKFNVDNISQNNGIYVQTVGFNGTGNFANPVSAITARLTGNPNASTNAAIYAETSANSFQSIAVWANAFGTNSNIGVASTAGSFGIVNIGNFGGRFSGVNGTSINTGLDASAFGPSGSSNYGVRGLASGAGSCYGVFGSASGTGAVNWAGFFQGDLFVSGQINPPSDATLKTNIVDYDSSLYVISQLQPRTFEFDHINYGDLHLSQGHQYGLIAQEVEPVLPSLVHDIEIPAQFDTLGNVISSAYYIKGLNYQALIPILVGGVQEQQTLINSQDSIIAVQDSLITDLNDRLSLLENCLSGIINTLCQINNSVIQENNQNAQDQIKSAIDVQLSDGNSIILNQNVPNPFAEQTVISYSIPEGVKRAEIHFYNSAGQLIKSVEISERGLGQLNVFASDLSSGIYTYTLVADGAIIATKKMQRMN